jgi:hypothetical protein
MYINPAESTMREEKPYTLCFRASREVVTWLKAEIYHIALEAYQHVDTGYRSETTKLDDSVKTNQQTSARNN